MQTGEHHNLLGLFFTWLQSCMQSGVEKRCTASLSEWKQTTATIEEPSLVRATMLPSAKPSKEV